MKKLISLALLLAMILSLAACGGAPAQSASPSSAPSSTPAESPAAPTDAPPASGTPWPEKAVTIVVPFGNGGDSDFNARVLTEYLQAELGQTFVIENISGSGGSIGTAAVAEAENDGYTILSNHNSIQISYASEIGKYNVSDFEIIGIYAQNPGDVIAVASSSGITDMKGLVEASQQKKMTVATNIGATTQVESFMLGEYANVTQVDVGAVADKIVALLGGQVDIIIGPYGNIQPYVESGDMNILGVCTPERAAGYPEVPTCKEQGYDIVWQTSFILGFPKGTDQAIVDKFGAAVKKIVTTNKDYADAIMASYYESPTWYDKDEALKLLQSAEDTINKYTLTALG